MLLLFKIVYITRCYIVFIKENSISVGYNLGGQAFFNLCHKYRKYINDIYFSNLFTMPGGHIDDNNILEILSTVDTYNMPLNLVMNRPDAHLEQNIDNLKSVYSVLNINRVTVIDLVVAKRISEEFPDIEIDLSTHSKIYDTSEIEDSNIKLHAINIDEPSRSMYTDSFFEYLRQNNIKVKYIVNRRCLYQKKDIVELLSSNKISCCASGSGITNRCELIMNHSPWVRLISVALYKEDLLYNPWIDCIKLSTRELSLVNIARLLSYWTSDDRTTFAYNIDIHDDNRYAKFMEIQKIKSRCSHECMSCMACKYMYDDLIQA